MGGGFVSTRSAYKMSIIINAKFGDRAKLHRQSDHAVDLL